MESNVDELHVLGSTDYDCECLEIETSYHRSRLSRQIFVGGLPMKVTPRLFRIWAEASFPGRVVNSVLVLDPVTHSRSRGFGFITFDSYEMVDYASNLRILRFAGTDVEVKRVEHISNTRRKQDLRQGKNEGGPHSNENGITHSENVSRAGDTVGRRLRKNMQWRERRASRKESKRQPGSIEDIVVEEAEDASEQDSSTATPKSSTLENDQSADSNPATPSLSWAQRLIRPPSPPKKPQAVGVEEDERALLSGFALAAPPPATVSEAVVRPPLFRRCLNAAAGAFQSSGASPDDCASPLPREPGAGGVERTQPPSEPPASMLGLWTLQSSIFQMALDDDAAAGD